MVVWRLAKRSFADLSGERARQYGGCWNSPGQPMLYATADAALALLDVRVHLDIGPDLLPDDYCYMEIDVGDLAMENVALPADWSDCRSIGDEWLASRRTPLLRAPSVIVPHSFDVFLNPQHPQAAQFQLVALHAYRFGHRLWE